MAEAPSDGRAPAAGTELTAATPVERMVEATEGLGPGGGHDSSNASLVRAEQMRNRGERLVPADPRMGGAYRAIDRAARIDYYAA